jgi:hypothetical protein
VAATSLATGGPAGMGAKLSIEACSSLVAAIYLSIVAMLDSICLTESFESS